MSNSMIIGDYQVLAHTGLGGAGIWGGGVRHFRGSDAGSGQFTGRTQSIRLQINDVLNFKM